MKTVSDVRSAFLDYFKGQGHMVLPSSPLVPHNDPTLMFTNAGMVQFKDIFTGKEKPLQPRAATSQKCVRAGGKHNDLDNVGYTARHHTFFEMLGNFSFGDYFKEGAILNAWDLITKTYDLPKDRLCVTVYHTDDEAANLWKKIAGLPDSKIIRIDTNDNFWAMGDTGPCGPCSEIFFDHGEKIAGGPPCSAEQDGDRFIEIWNLVFMQYEKLVDGSQINLPKPSIDTGMGLERISAILQGVHDNYDIDLFKNLIAASKHEARSTNNENSHRIIADHLRSTSFLIADGVLPSSEGRGYVLRRIMRRAMRHAHQLGCKDPLMYRLVPALIREMGQQYPELIRAEKLITETLKTEEERFKVTLERGLKLLETESRSLKPEASLSGEVAFKLYDTFGFPLDLTQDILRAENREVDTKGFEAAMQEQKKKARAAWSGSGEKATDDVWFSVREEVGATEFLGYESQKASGKIVAMLREGRRVRQASEGDVIQLITNQTPFYGESGGQMGDHGIIALTPSPLPRGEGQRGITPTNELLIEFAREMRKNATDAEKLIWSILRGRQLEGYKFRRQHPIGEYIADFCSIENKIIIELDGGHHAEQKEKDAISTQELERLGFKVLRFWNNEVLQNIEGVVSNISSALHTGSGAPLSLGERGWGEGDAVFLVSDTKKMLGDVIVHMGVVKKGMLRVDNVASMEIDQPRRQAIRANHSATHLLHAVLRKVLGEHVTQKGSLVDEDRLRFDFSHNKAVSAEEIAQIEREVNAMIRANNDAATKLMTPEAAIEAGAMALFGEKYGDEVRVVSFGSREQEAGSSGGSAATLYPPPAAYSIELCSGTHVARTGDIGLFKITKETSISAGVRRIEAVTAEAALDAIAISENILNRLAAEFKSPPEEVLKRVENLIEERKKLERDLADAKRKLAMGIGGTGGSCPVPEDVNGVKFLGLELQDISAKDLKPIIDEYKQNLGSGIVAIAASFEGKVSLVVGVTADLTTKYNAVDLVRVGAEILGGKGGGGRPDMAQAGGADIVKIDAALKAIKELM